MVMENAHSETLKNIPNDATHRVNTEQTVGSRQPNRNNVETTYLIIM